jgi:hypothetical protein
MYSRTLGRTLLLCGIFAAGISRAETLNLRAVDPLVETGFHAEYLVVRAKPSNIAPFRLETPDAMTWGGRVPFSNVKLPADQAPASVQDFFQGVLFSNRREFIPAREELFTLSDLSLGYVPNPITGVLLVGVFAAIAAKFKGFHRDSLR